VTARARVFAIVAALAGTAAVVTVGATMLSSAGEPRAARDRPAPPRPGAPPVLLDLGVRSDPEARALRRAAALHSRGSVNEARRIFARYGSLDAEVGAAVAAWPDGALARLETLAHAHPRSALVQLHLGLARYWLRRDRDALAAWRKAARIEPDTASAVRADDLLHPNLARGLPVFVPAFDLPPAVARLRPDRQLVALRRRAAAGAGRDRLLYGVALQRLGRPLSARRVFEEAAAAAPDDAEAQVAAAIGRFDKDDPSNAFSRLGPLARRFPQAPSVRFHLGLLLLWIGRVDEAKAQLAQARALGPRTPIGREAKRFLDRLEGVG
jgi:tetratricopeptide (TPR) repeat protein